MNRTLPDNTPRRPFAYLDEVDCRPLNAGLLQRIFWIAAPAAVAFFGFCLAVAS